MTLTPEIIAAIQAAVTVSSSSSPVEAFHQVRLVATEEGFRACGGSGHVQVIADAPAAGRETFDLMVPADRLAKILANARGEISFAVTEKSLNVRAGTSRFVVPRYTAAEFPLMAEDEKKSTIVIPTEWLTQAIHLVLPFAAVKDMARYYLETLCIHLEDKQLNFVATDGAGLAWLCKDIEDESKAQILIIQHLLRRIRPLLTAESLTLSIGARLTIQSGALTIDLPVVDTAYPGWRRVLPPDADAIQVKAADATAVFGEALLAVGAVKGFVFGSVAIENDGIRVSGGREDQGAYEGLIPRSAMGSKAHNAGFNLNALHQLAGLFPKDAELQIGYAAGTHSPFRVTSEALPGYVTVYMPARG